MPTTDRATANTAQEAENADPIVQAIAADEPLIERLRAAQVVLARCYAQLRWLDENPDSVNDLVEAGRAISRRVRTIKRLIEIELADRSHHGHHFETESPEARVVYGMLVERVGQVAAAVLPAEKAAEVMSRWRAELEEDPAVPWP